MKNKIAKLEEEMSQLKKKQSSANFWDYEQIKEKWVKEFKREMLADIKSNGLEIGSRWKVQQQGTSLAIRDLEGSKNKDSRFAVAAETYSNSK